MQQLMLEPNWDKTIAYEDRIWIESQFEQLTLPANASVSFTVMWHAFNHRDQLLVTALIHNQSNQPITMKNKPITWGNQASGAFTIPIEIAAHYSMPWTFIFTDYSGELNHDAQLKIDHAS